MSPERYQQIQALLQSALEHDDDKREAFLREACAGDELLRRQVESLMISHERAGSFLESPSAKVAAPLVTDAQTKLVAGQPIGSYRILSHLGSGGMGEVYLAEDARLKRKVALKLLPSDFTKDEDRVRRFEQEAYAASALNHPGILTIYEVGQTVSEHFIATEFIDGETLRARLTRGPVNLSEALDIGLQLASALAEAHGSGIVHRDIKPENIMIRRDGYVKVLDFGLAKLTEIVPAGQELDLEAATRVKTNPGMVLGTVSYMSPEQARGLEVDARTDIWSLGVVLYEMAAGQVPFKGATMSHVIVSILDREPAPLTQHVGETGGELERIVGKALAKERAQRYQRASDMLVDLRHTKQEMEFDEKLRRSDPSGAEMVGRSRGERVLKSSNPAKFSGSKLAAPRSSRKRATKAIHSLAILPLVNVGDDPNLEYLSDGITESIINSLSQLPGLKVQARSAVFRYKGREVDPQQVGSELGVRAVLTGRVIQVGEKLIVKAELVDASDGSQIWGEQYNRQLSDILEVQDKIAREISEKLRLKLSTKDKQRLGKRYTQDTEAYQLYLQGRYYWNKRTEDGLKKGVSYFNQAIELDPIYALAYAGLADCYILLGVYGAVHPGEIVPRAKAAVSKALDIDSTLAEVRTPLAGIKAWFDWDWPGAEQEFNRAIELNPNYATAHHWYSILILITTGRVDEAIAAARRGQELEALSLPINTDVGWIFYFARQHDRAIEQYRKTLEIDSNFWRTHLWLGWAFEQKGMYEEAVSEMQKARDLSADSPLMSVMSLAHAYAVAGKRDEAQKLLDRLHELSTKRYVSSYEIGYIYVGLGERDKAFEWLEKAFEEGSPWMVWLGVDPRWDPLRSDPRFNDLMKRVGLWPE